MFQYFGEAVTKDKVKRHYLQRDSKGWLVRMSWFMRR